MSKLGCKGLTESPISYEDFEKVDMRVGKIIDVREFPEARKPAYKLKVDFGPDIGIKNSSAQLTVRYKKESLMGRKVVAVMNFPPKQVANYLSEVLVLGVNDARDGIVLLRPESDDAPLGVRVH
jgi:tRNA-binding protein